MRLIDADEALNLIDGETKVETNSNVKAFNDALEVAIQIIDTQKTVEAIPIEFIEKRIKKALAFTHSKAEGNIIADRGFVTITSASFTAQVLANLLKAWEKENEID